MVVIIETSTVLRQNKPSTDSAITFSC